MIKLRLFTSQEYSNKPLCYLHTFDNSGCVSFGHSSFEKLLKKNIITKDYYDTSYKFTFVRNPYDRFVSLYFYFKLNNVMKFKQFVEYFGKHFNEIVPKIGLSSSFQFNDKLLYDYEGSQFNLQTSWIPHDINFIGKFENLLSDFNKLLTNIGYEYQENKLDLINVSKHDIYYTYYDKYTADIIANIYNDDFVRFNYSKDIQLS